MNLKYLFYTCILFLFGQIGVWFQLNAQFFWDWAKKNPLILTLLGLPFTYTFILATNYGIKAFNGVLWPQRFLGFSIGIIIYGLLTYFILHEGITTKTMISLCLAFLIILVQILMK